MGPVILLLMPLVLSTLRLGLNVEWANPLTGLPMAVPSFWWPGYDGNNLNCGRIVGIDIDVHNDKIFQVEIDSEMGAVYHMHYHDILDYADEGSDTFDNYRLPHLPPQDPAIEGDISVHRHPAQRPRRLLDRYGNTTFPVGDEGNNDEVKIPPIFYRNTTPDDWRRIIGTGEVHKPRTTEPVL